MQPSWDWNTQRENSKPSGTVPPTPNSLWWGPTPSGMQGLALSISSALDRKLKISSGKWKCTVESGFSLKGSRDGLELVRLHLQM